MPVLSDKNTRQKYRTIKRCGKPEVVIQPKHDNNYTVNYYKKSSKSGDDTGYDFWEKDLDK